MARAGREMRNPITHEHFTFLRITNDIWVHRVLMAIGTGTGQLLGYDPEFSEYRSHDLGHIERIAG